MSDGKHLIVFVCTGNICRSPMAEYVMRHRLGGDTRWTVQSAGVFAMDGAPASMEAVQALAELGIGPSEADLLLREADPDAGVDELVRHALRRR